MAEPKPKLPPQTNPPNSDDGVLESIGKAITDPVESGAEEEERKRDNGTPDTPGG